MRELAPLRLDELASTPVRLAITRELAAEPAAIFAELGDPSLWFPLMRRSVWRTAATSGVDSERELDVRFVGRFRERMLVWQPGERLAYTVTATTSPLLAQLVEDWRLMPTATGTRLEWTMGAVPTSAGRPAMPAMRLFLRVAFVRGARLLERRAAAYPRTHGRKVS